MSLLWGVCTSPGMLCSGSDSELRSSGHISTCYSHLQQQAVQVIGSPVIPARVWHGPCVARGELQPQVLEDRSLVRAHVLTAAQGQSPAACLCAR